MFMKSKQMNFQFLSKEYRICKKMMKMISIREEIDLLMNIDLLMISEEIIIEVLSIIKINKEIELETILIQDTKIVILKILKEIIEI